MIRRPTKKKLTCWALALAFPLGLASPWLALADKKTPSSNLSGRWLLNKELSENPRDKMREAMSRGGGPDGFPGGPPPGGGPGGPPLGDGFPGGPPGEGRRLPGREDMRRIMEAAEVLEITQGGIEVTINETGGGEIVRTRTVYTDGQQTEQNTPVGKAETKAKWKDKKLVVETKTERGGKVTETFELKESGRRLHVTTKIENERFPQPLTFRRVYDSAGASTN